MKVVQEEGIMKRKIKKIKAGVGGEKTIKLTKEIGKYTATVE